MISKWLRNVGRVVAGLLVLPTAVAITVCVFVLAMVPALTKPDNIKVGLEQQEIYDDLLPEVLPTLLELDNNVENNLPIAFTEIRQSMSNDDWRAVANELVPPTFLQQQLESLLDSIWDYALGAPTISYQLDVDTLMTRLTGEPGSRAITRITTLATPCNAEQVDIIRELNPLSPGTTRLPACSPANTADQEKLQLAYEVVFRELARFIRSDETALSEVSVGDWLLTEEITGSETGELSLDANENLSVLLDIRAFFQTYELYEPIFYFLPAAMLSLIVLFGVHSLKGFARWMSITLLLGGVNILAATVAFSAGIITVPGTTAPPNMPDISPEILALQDRIVSGIMAAAFTEIGPQVIGAAAFLFLLGGVLMVFSVIVRGPQAVVRLREDATILEASATV